MGRPICQVISAAMSFALATKASTALPRISQRAASGKETPRALRDPRAVERAIDAGGAFQRTLDVDTPVDGADGLQCVGHVSFK